MNDNSYPNIRDDGKFCYLDKKSAQGKKNYLEKQTGRTLYIYPCADHWHLTKKAP